MLNFGPQTSIFRGYNQSIYDNAVNNKTKQSIFGNDIPQVSKAKIDPRSAACCVVQASGTLPSGGFAMNEFYSTVWRFNLRNILSSKMAFGESCCI